MLPEDVPEQDIEIVEGVPEQKGAEELKQGEKSGGEQELAEAKQKQERIKQLQAENLMALYPEFYGQQDEHGKTIAESLLDDEAYRKIFQSDDAKRAE